MNTPGFGAESSLYRTSERYEFVPSLIEGTGKQGISPGITPQQDFTSAPVPPFFRCSPCVDGRQFCCPPPGFGLRCFVRRCREPF
jgi:hypothetical protein